MTVSQSDREARLRALEELPWVTYVGETDRSDASHKVETDLGVVRRTHEIHEVENLGITHVATSTMAPNARLYVDV